MTSRSKINGILKRCGQLLDQHYHYIGYTPPDEEMSSYRVARKQLYCLIELQEVVDLEYRLEKLHTQLREAGANKSKLTKTTRMDVIAASPDLSEAALVIAEALLKRYELQVFAVSINLDEIPQDEEEEEM